jgi:hypothetical protein
MKICPVGAGLLRADGQTDMTKLMVAFRNFANAPKTAIDKIASSWGKVTEKYEWREGSRNGEVRAWFDNIVEVFVNDVKAVAAIFEETDKKGRSRSLNSHKEKSSEK